VREIGADSRVDSEARLVLSVVEESLSDVKAARATIISHSTIIAANTSPMPRPVISRDWINTALMLILI
jgi:hypothetical protein